MIQAIASARTASQLAVLSAVTAGTNVSGLLLARRILNEVDDEEALMPARTRAFVDFASEMVLRPTKAGNAGWKDESAIINIAFSDCFY